MKLKNLKLKNLSKLKNLPFKARRFWFKILLSPILLGFILFFISIDIQPMKLQHNFQEENRQEKDLKEEDTDSIESRELTETSASAIENGEKFTEQSNQTTTANKTEQNEKKEEIVNPPPPPPPGNGSCPVSTQNCIPCTLGEHWACRVEPGETEGFLGWSCQNNNPGNIRYSDVRINYIQTLGGPAPCGERIDSRGGTYMIFSTYNDGRNGLKAYFKAISNATHTAYSECADGDCSLAYVFSKYAPGDVNYAQNIADKIGVDISTPLQWVIANKFEELINAVQSKEGFFTQ